MGNSSHTFPFSWTIGSEEEEEEEKKTRREKKQSPLWHSARYFSPYPFNCLKSLYIVLGSPLPTSFYPHPSSPLQLPSVPVALLESWVLLLDEPPGRGASECLSYWDAALWSDAENISQHLT